MSYLINYKGLRIVAKSVEDAVRLARKLAEETAPNRKRKHVEEMSGQLSSKDQITSFWSALDSESQRVLKSLANNQNGLVTDELAKGANIDTVRLKYVLKKVHSKAKAHGLDGKSLMVTEGTYIGGVPKSHYQMNRSMADAIKDIAEKVHQ